MDSSAIYREENEREWGEGEREREGKREGETKRL